MVFASKQNSKTQTSFGQPWPLKSRPSSWLPPGKTFGWGLMSIGVWRMHKLYEREVLCNQSFIVLEETPKGSTPPIRSKHRLQTGGSGMCSDSSTQPHWASLLWEGSPNMTTGKRTPTFSWRVRTGALAWVPCVLWSRFLRGLLNGAPPVFSVSTDTFKVLLSISPIHQGSFLGESTFLPWFRGTCIWRLSREVIILGQNQIYIPGSICQEV